jgi:hypothetical protein
MASTASLKWLQLLATALAMNTLFAILQTHTFEHADFMARMLIVPIALGWGALGWQVVEATASPAARR